MQSSDSINVGDIVAVKSGGPLMNVTGFHSQYNIVCCAWFDDENHIQYYQFPSNCLELVRENSPRE